MLATYSVRHAVDSEIEGVIQVVDIVRRTDWISEAARLNSLVNRLHALARYRVSVDPGVDLRTHLRRLIREALAIDAALDLREADPIEDFGDVADEPFSRVIDLPF